MKKFAGTLIFLFALSSCYAQTENSYDAFGGFTVIKGKKTGWFKTQQLNGRWYFVTPEGNAFFSLGVTHAIECIELDEQKLFETKYGQSEEKLSSFFLDCFKDWGYNSSGYGPLHDMEKHIPYVAEIWTIGPRSFSAGKKSINADIFDPVVQKKMKQIIREAVVRHRNNPNCLGYVFIDCPLWGVIPQKGISYVDFIRSLRPEAPGKIAYVNFLKLKHANNIKSFNEVYGVKAKSFDELHKVNMEAVSPKNNEKVFKDDEEFLNILADTYFNCTTSELRKSDPNHLVLGDRFMAATPMQSGMKVPDSIIATAGKYFDVISFQPMGTQALMKDYIDHVNSITGKPVLFADVNTMTSRLTQGQTDTREYEISAGQHTLRYYLDASESKALIGIHRCTVRDYLPWNTNYYRRGLLKADDTPYYLLVDYTKQTNRQVVSQVYEMQF